MKRGDVWWVAFAPSIGGEIRKTRPAVIVSNNYAKEYLNRVQGVPLSSRIDQVYPTELTIFLHGNPNKTLVAQGTTSSKARFHNFIGNLSEIGMKRIRNAIKIQLSLG